MKTPFFEIQDGYGRHIEKKANPYLKIVRYIWSHFICR